MTLLSITASVGRGGVNRPTDVHALKDRLLALGFDWSSADDRADAALEGVIDPVHSIVRGRASVSGDGRVDVPGGTSHTSATYDRDATRAMLQAFRHQPQLKRVLFNDPTLRAEGLCQRAAGHDDHFHVEIEPLRPLVGYDAGYDAEFDRAITAFSGTVTDPGGFPLTQDGFQRYLDAVGVRHFSAREMLTPHHPDRATALGYGNFLPPHAWWPRGAALALIADELRGLVGEPVKMRNWWRPTPYNAQVDGAADSDHITAHGVDLDYRSAASRRAAEARLRRLFDGEAWLQLSLGLGNATTHVGILSPGRKREWRYDSYVP